MQITGETGRDLYLLATTQVQEIDNLLMCHTSIPLVEEDGIT